jgi:hypothetical protein
MGACCQHAPGHAGTARWAFLGLLHAAGRMLSWAGRPGLTGTFAAIMILIAGLFRGPAAVRLAARAGHRDRRRWTIDRLATLARAKPLLPTRASPATILQTSLSQWPRTVPARLPPQPDQAVPEPGTATGRPMLAPKFAACCKIVMSIAMGYMLILMIQARRNPARSQLRA